MAGFRHGSGGRIKSLQPTNLCFSWESEHKPQTGRISGEDGGREGGREGRRDGEHVCLRRKASQGSDGKVSLNKAQSKDTAKWKDAFLLCVVTGTSCAWRCIPCSYVPLYGETSTNIAWHIAYCNFISKFCFSLLLESGQMLSLTNPALRERKSNPIKYGQFK